MHKCSSMIPQNDDKRKEDLKMFEFMRSQINTRKGRSAWDSGVSEYALDIIDSIEERAIYENETPAGVKELLRWALNGATDWTQYSEGGCALVYNRQIAERLCTPSELKKTQNGMKDPERHERPLPARILDRCSDPRTIPSVARVELAYRAFLQITKGGC